MIAVDHALSIFIADTGNNVIRQVAGTGVSGKTQGDIYTVAGNHTAGFTGDGGAATAAELNAPNGLAIDASGNLLVGDSQNLRVRSIAAIANVAPLQFSATVSPTSLTFASTTVGAAAPTQTVTFTNTGAGVVNVTGITIAGANAGDYTETDTCVNAVGGIAPLIGTCTITVTFKPTATGASAATLMSPTTYREARRPSAFQAPVQRPRCPSQLRIPTHHPRRPLPLAQLPPTISALLPTRQAM